MEDGFSKDMRLGNSMPFFRQKASAPTQLLSAQCLLKGAFSANLILGPQALYFYAGCLSMLALLSFKGMTAFWLPRGGRKPPDQAQNCSSPF